MKNHGPIGQGNQMFVDGGRKWAQSSGMTAAREHGFLDHN